MATHIYSKPQITVEDQASRLEQKGLTFEDKSRALHLLRNISLFRLKSYLKPFEVRDTHQYSSGSTFENAYALYKFDASLRKAICSELEKIEISVRTQFSMVMGDMAGVFWFEDPQNFSNADKHQVLLRSLKEELRRCDDEALLEFRRKYSNPFPPSWMTFEVSSFGTLSMMYRWLKPGHARRKVSAFYGLPDTVFESWMHTLVYTRNICAHHSRLWNRHLRINAIVPRRTRLPFIETPSDTKRVYYVLSIVLYLLQTINPNNTFAERIKSMLRAYPMVDVSAMGFPKDWTSQPLWS